MISRRIAASLIGAGIILSGTAHATQPSPEHKITICHSGNGKHYSAIKVDYAGALGHAKTDEFDIIPAFEDFPGQNLTPDNIYRLERQCNEATTTTTQSTPTSTPPTAPSSTTTSTVPSTILPTTTTTTLPATTVTSTITTLPASTTTLLPATTTTTTVPVSDTVTTTTTLTSVPAPSSSTTTTIQPTTTSVAQISSTATNETLPVTGSEPTGLIWGGLVLIALGLTILAVSKWN